MSDYPMVERVVRRRGVEPATFLVRDGTSDEKAIAEVWAHNSYQRRSAGLVIEPGDRWLDMGANVGGFTVLASRMGAASVAAYEAEPANALITRRNIQRNRVRATVYNAAIVGDAFEGETVTLNVNAAPLALRRHSIMRARKDTAGTITVRATRFAAALEHGDCVKMNIEGAEIPVLHDLTLEAARAVRKLVFEWSFDIEPRMAVLRGTLDRLERWFPHVALSKSNLPWEQETYPYYPPNVFVYAWR